MKALLQKEFREALKLGVLGLIIFTLHLLLICARYHEWIKGIALGDTREQRMLQPLWGSDLWLPVGFFCAIFAAVLGWKQMFNERHRELWGFLIHRPVTPTRIFLAKVLAGLSVYLVVVGLPLMGYLSWALTPGNVAAPFEWPMLLPLLAFCLSGVPYYFAGMLTGMRRARWYASRAIGLGAAIVVTGSMVAAPHFWQALLAILVGISLLALASWGAFRTNGFDCGQPPVAQRALALALAFGWTAVVLPVGNMLGDLVSRLDQREPWSYYRMTKEGTILKVTKAHRRPSQVTDLQGNPARDSRSGEPIVQADLDGMAAQTAIIHPYFGEQPRRSNWLIESGGSLQLWRATPHTLWCYWRRYGRLVGYDVLTRRFIGSFGPKGFSPELHAATDRFSGHSSRTFRTATGVYGLDLQNRTVRELFSTGTEDSLGGVSDITRDDYDWEYTLVASRQFIHLLAPDGHMLFKTPFQPAYPQDRLVKLHILEPRGRFALWIAPAHDSAENLDRMLSARVTWFDGGQQQASTDLPPISRPANLDSERNTVALLLPPGLVAACPWFSNDPLFTLECRMMLRFSLVFSVGVCLPMGYWLSRRCRLESRACFGWLAFLVISGAPGLLAMASVEEWPARELCPKCKKLRVVTRQTCEHCGAGVAPPAAKGIEVFEPVRNPVEREAMDDRRREQPCG